MPIRSRMPLLAGALWGAILLAGTPAYADEDAPAAPALSITVSPIHLFIPLVEVHVEAPVAVDGRVSLVGILGAGATTVKDSGNGDIDMTILQVGGQGRFYVADPMEGFHIGGEGILIEVYADSETDADVNATAAGVSLGLFGGWKYVGDSGFTFVAHVGYQTTGVGAEAKNSDTGEEFSESEESQGPLINLDFGWSF